VGITIKDVAREAGVSVSTVSVVLRGAKNPFISQGTAERVRAAAKALGYRPNLAARSLRAKYSHTVGMVTHITRGLSARTIAEIELLLRNHGYDLLLGFSDNTPEREWRYIDKLYGVRVDGLLIAPSRYKEEESLEHYRAILAPIVLIDGPENPDFCCTKKDRAAGIGILLRHLHGLGRRKVALSLVRDMGYGNRERLEGYRQALGALGLPCDERRLLWCTPAPIVNGSEVVTGILERRGEIDAVICSDDFMAADVITGLRAAGVDVPGDVSVVGFFDNPNLSASFEVPITTLRHDFIAMGRKACELLLERMKRPANEEPLPAVTWSPVPELVVRESCGAGVLHA